jgi:hypothetical protein
MAAPEGWRVSDVVIVGFVNGRRSSLDENARALDGRSLAAKRKQGPSRRERYRVLKTYCSRIIASLSTISEKKKDDEKRKRPLYYRLVSRLRTAVLVPHDAKCWTVPCVVRIRAVSIRSMGRCTRGDKSRSHSSMRRSPDDNSSRSD